MAEGRKGPRCSRCGDHFGMGEGIAQVSLIEGQNRDHVFWTSMLCGGCFDRVLDYVNEAAKPLTAKAPA